MINSEDLKSYFVSDLHLKSIHERNAQLFLNFLRRLKQEAKNQKIELILLGDIFDLWLSDHQVFVDRFEAILFELKELRSVGVTIHYFEGNHDLHLDVYFEKEMGVLVYTRAQYFLRGDQTLRIEHGDYINPEDKVYHRYLRLIRTPIVEEIGHRIPGIFWDTFGQAASRLSRRKAWSRKPSPQKDKLKRLLIDYTKNVYQESPFDVLITGHIHLFADEEILVKGKNIYSKNLGSWYDHPKTLVLFQGKWKWQDLIKEGEHELTVHRN